MDRKILKTVSTMDDLNIKELKTMNLGVEIQDFTEPNLSVDERSEIINFYKKKLKDFNGIKSLHGPFLDLKPASPDKEITEVCSKSYLETLTIAEELNMDYTLTPRQGIFVPYLDGLQKDLGQRE